MRASSLASELAVSEMTVRRDLDHLAGRGDLLKVRGGATLNSSRIAAEHGFTKKLSLQTAEKLSLAAEAATLVEPGMSIALNSGTTTFALAGHCAQVNHLTVVTNSPRIAQVFYTVGNASQNIILTGGTRTASDALVGPLALSALKQLHVDILFLGVHGMSLKDGFTSPNMLEMHMNRAFMDAAAQHVVVADHTKWGIVGGHQIAPLSAVDSLVTGSALDPQAVEDVRKSIGTLWLA